MRTALGALGIALLCHPLSAAEIRTAPTTTQLTALRGGPGRYQAPRLSGGKHHGVDIVATASTTDKEVYAVRAVHDAVVAYAALNSTADKPGYGYTVILDHDNGTYTLYAHLAKVSSSGLVKVGDVVKAGQIVGYIFDPTTNENSSGDVVNCTVLPYEKTQLHFEMFNASRGRKEQSIKKMLEGGSRVDPTAELFAAGFVEYPPPSDAEKKKKEQQCKAEAHQ